MSAKCVVRNGGGEPSYCSYIDRNKSYASFLYNSPIFVGSWMYL